MTIEIYNSSLQELKIAKSEAEHARVLLMGMASKLSNLTIAKANSDVINDAYTKVIAAAIKRDETTLVCREAFRKTLELHAQNNPKNDDSSR